MAKASLGLCTLLVASVLFGCHTSTATESDGGDLDAADTVSADTSRRDVGPSVWGGESPFMPDPNKMDVLVVSHREAFYSGYVGAPVPWVFREMLSARPALDLRFAALDPDIGDPTGVLCDAPTTAAGRLKLPETCTGLPQRLFVPVDADSSIADLTGEVRCRAAGDCMYRQPFDALLSAMLPSGSGIQTNTRSHHGDMANADFFRRDAFLSILIVVSPDDCSFDPDIPVDANPFARCILHADRLRPISHYVDTLLRIRPADTFGVFATVHMPEELDGEEPEVILADPSMAPGSPFDVTLSASGDWSADASLYEHGGNSYVGRRIVELLAALKLDGVRVGAFSLARWFEGDARPALVAVARPIAHRMLGID